MFGRRKLAALVAEFLGVAVITMVILAVNKSGVGFSYFLAAGAGLALTFLLLGLGRFSLGHFNPAVTLGLWSIRKINIVDAIAYIAAQFLGASVAWRLFQQLADQELKNIAGKGQWDWRVFTAEAIGAMLLMLFIAAALYHQYNRLKWAITAGGALYLGMLVASLGSNGVVNPAVSLGLQSWNASYAVGPLVGALIGATLYSSLFAPAAGLDTAPARALARRRKTAANKTSAAAARSERAVEEKPDKPAAKATKPTKKTSGKKSRK